MTRNLIARRMFQFQQALFLLSIVVLVVMTATVKGDALARMQGRWGVTWRTDQHPWRTGFVVEVSTNVMVLHREGAKRSTLVLGAEALMRFLHVLERKNSIRRSTCVPPDWLVNFPRSVKATVSDEGIHLNDCAAEHVTLPRPMRHGESAFGTMLEKPQHVYFPARNVCSKAPFAVRGYWLEWMRTNELLMVLVLQFGGENCSLVFQLDRDGLEETSSQSLMALVSLLVAVALMKCLSRLYWRKKGRVVDDHGFLAPRRQVLSVAKRQELLRQQEDIVRRMKEQDGIR